MLLLNLNIFIFIVIVDSTFIHSKTNETFTYSQIIQRNSKSSNQVIFPQSTAQQVRSITPSNLSTSMYLERPSSPADISINNKEVNYD